MVVGKHLAFFAYCGLVVESQPLAKTRLKLLGPERRVSRVDRLDCCNGIKSRGPEKLLFPTRIG